MDQSSRGELVLGSQLTQEQKQCSVCGCNVAVGEGYLYLPVHCWIHVGEPEPEAKPRPKPAGNASQRFVVQRERPPANRPVWWRGMYQVWDQSLRTIRESFWSWGAADKYARCLNGELSPFLCRDAAPQQSHAERWALAA